MAELPPAEVQIYLGVPTQLRPGEGDDQWLVLGPNRTHADVRPDRAVIQARRIGWLTPDGRVWSELPPAREGTGVPIFIPLELP